MPTIQAVNELDRSAEAQKITTELVADIDPTEAMMSIAFPGRPEEPVLLSRWQIASVAVQVRGNRRK